MTFAERHAGAFRQGFYRTAQGRLLSNLGIGTYLGEQTGAASAAYIDAVHEAVARGINVIDTAINYRHTRSERDIGAAWKRIEADGIARREDLLICTKAGFLTPGAIPRQQPAPADIAGGMHCIQPDFLEDQIERSLRHMGLDFIDVLYLHNPETQLGSVSREEFDKRMLAAFDRLERLCGKGLIRCYGAATWSGFRVPASHPQALSLSRLLELAHQSGGARHRFRFVQLPFNLAMPEAFLGPPPAHGFAGESFLEAAAKAGLTVVSSAPLVQGRLLESISPELIGRLRGPASPAEFALQFARSAPGVTVTLAGMGRPDHVRHNLALAQYPPASAEEFAALFRKER